MTTRPLVQTFTQLAEDLRFPEGLAVTTDGTVFASTLDFGNENFVVRFDSSGREEARVSFGGAPLLGLALDEDESFLYIANFNGGAGQIEKLPTDFTESTVRTLVAEVPVTGAPEDRLVGNPDGSNDIVSFGEGGRAPNGLYWKENTLYFTDSFQAAIFKINDVESCNGCIPDLVIQDPLLATAGFPGFGANGLAMGVNNDILYVSNTGDDRVLKVDVTVPKVEVFAESVDGADGLLMDEESGILWVAANQADQILGLNKDGRVVARLGGNPGLTRDGVPMGLLVPASIAMRGRYLYVTNLALILTEAVGDEIEEFVTATTISQIPVPLST